MEIVEALLAGGAATDLKDEVRVRGGGVVRVVGGSVGGGGKEGSDWTSAGLAWGDDFAAEPESKR
eukprot:3734784-Rhodomonas_salina.1